MREFSWWTEGIPLFAPFLCAVRIVTTDWDDLIVIQRELDAGPHDCGGSMGGRTARSESGGPREHEAPGAFSHGACSAPSLPWQVIPR